jgi:Uma2 family endonuclease
MAVMLVDNLLTREELDGLPDDGLRHELIDGAFVMTPAPGVGHQRMAAELYAALRVACAGTDLRVLFAPLDVVLGTSVVQPDLVVAPVSAFTERDLPSPPLLVVEVRSASTGWLDEGRKRTLYEEHGVAHYWLADPAAPAITVLGLVDGRYQQTAVAVGHQTIHVDVPFAVALNPATLARG